jgi:hypothetical protein
MVSRNAAGVRVWAPSLKASEGWGWTSKIKPSQPAATEARDMEGTNEAIPVP